MLSLLAHKKPSYLRLVKNSVLYSKCIPSGLSSKLKSNHLACLLSIYCIFHKTILIECIVKDNNGNDHLIGSSLYAQSIFTRRIYNIILLAVDNNFRRRRVGSLLLTTGEDMIKDSSPSSSLIKVKTINTIKNKAIIFYMQHGFTANSWHRNFLCMSKEI